MAVALNEYAGFPSQLTALAELFSARGFSLYAVGGMVRNGLLGFPVHDIDITSAMPPNDVISMCKNNGLKVLDIGYKFGMVEIHIGGMRCEHTTFRRDTYGFGGNHRPAEVSFSDNLDEDARRRDFTVNAVYAEIPSGRLFDPTGGIEDMEGGLIRATSEDPDIIMRDDALRILRMARFAAELGFAVEPSTLDSARRFAPQLAHISAERIRDELLRILMADSRCGIPADRSVLCGLELLDRCGAIDVILPELGSCRGVKQRPQYHEFDVLNHLFHSAACAKPFPILRVAALLHDVGKPVALSKYGRMYGHDAIGADISREILENLRFSNTDIDTVVWLVAHHMFDLQNTAKDATLRRNFVRWGADRVRLLADIREADFRGSLAAPVERVASAERWRSTLDAMLLSDVPFSEGALNCTGHDIMEWLNIPPSPKVGALKAALLRHCAVRPNDNTPARLRAIARNYVDILPSSEGES